MGLVPVENGGGSPSLLLNSFVATRQKMASPLACRFASRRGVSSSAPVQTLTLVTDELRKACEAGRLEDVQSAQAKSRGSFFYRPVQCARLPLADMPSRWLLLGEFKLVPDEDQEESRSTSGSVIRLSRAFLQWVDCSFRIDCRLSLITFACE